MRCKNAKNAKNAKLLSIIHSVELRVLFLHSPSHAIVASGYPYVIVSKCKKMQNTLDNSIRWITCIIFAFSVRHRSHCSEACVRTHTSSIALFFVARTYVRSNAKNAKIIFCIFCISFIFSFPTIPTRPRFFISHDSYKTHTKETTLSTLPWKPQHPFSSLLLLSPSHHKIQKFKNAKNSRSQAHEEL